MKTKSIEIKDSFIDQATPAPEPKAEPAPAPKPDPEGKTSEHADQKSTAQPAIRHERPDPTPPLRDTRSSVAPDSPFKKF